MDLHPATFSDWATHLERAWALVLTDLTHWTPLRLVGTTRTGHVAVFSGAGTTLRLAVFEPSAVVVVMLRPDCDCGEPHSDRAVPRVQLNRSAQPLWQGSVDGTRRYGWRGVDAATAPVPQSASVMDELLNRARAEIPHAFEMTGTLVRGRTRAGSAEAGQPQVASAA